MSAERQKIGKLHKETDHNECYLNNMGYSFMELVIVLAIIAVIMTTVFFSVILIFSANAKSTAHDIQRSIADCKVTTMGRSAAYMELYRSASDENVYTRMYVWDSSAAGYVASEPQKIGPKRVFVAYKLKGGGQSELTAGDKIEIRFNRATGGLDESVAKDAGGNIHDIIIYVEGGSKKYEITLTALTGKAELKAK